MGIFTKSINDKKERFEKRGSRRNRWIVLAIILIAVLAGLLDYPVVWNKAADWLNQKTPLGLPHFFGRPFRLGLDLQGGTHLVYQADLSNIEAKDYNDSMQGVRDVIERRINIFGVTEPVVQVNKAGSNYRLIVELAGIKDIHQAIEMIGQTPALDFREERAASETETILADQKQIKEKFDQGLSVSEDEQRRLLEDPYFRPTALTGRFLKGAELSFDQSGYQTQVNLQFNDEGSKLFEDLTKNNVGKRLAIYLDGVPISAPQVQEAIAGGRAQITGNFSLQEAKDLVQRLNAGALPVPITLISQQTVGASLGQISLNQSLRAGLWGFLLVLIFMLIYYRLPGLMAGLALLVYIALLLAIFKLIPVTLTLAGIAGFILSIGMAVDANVLIFERLKEELRAGRPLSGGLEEGFRRAWPAIRDSNLTTIITCLILYFIATGLVKGFALTLGIGVLLSMFSAIIVTRAFLRGLAGGKLEGWRKVWGK